MPDAPKPARSGTHHAVLAGFLGWTLDAFDFFVVVFLFDTLAHQFGVTKREIVWTTTATLAMRPVGALVFGLLSDRHGRRVGNWRFTCDGSGSAEVTRDFERHFAEWLFDRILARRDCGTIFAP